MQKYKCRACGYIYDSQNGGPDSGMGSGTSFEELPEVWGCWVYGVNKDLFEPLTK
ncbi:MAG: rubredoxin [Candidatus Omnitrophica bacterium]|nr:rubredoxin [Candidatus Omnitrophota bacterium]